MRLEYLPPQAHLRIASSLETAKDLNALSRTNRYFHKVTGRLLYSRDITKNEAWCIVWAVSISRVATISRILTYRIDLDFQYLALVAIREKRPDVLEWFFQKGYLSSDQINAICKSGRTLLFEAVMSKSISCATVLLNRRADIQTPGIDQDEAETELDGFYDEPEEHFMPLSEATAKGHLQMVELLIQYKADIDLSQDGPPVTIAATKGHIACLELMLDNGAEVDIVDDQGKTPLQHAMERGRYREAELLISHGADVQVSVHDKTPLEIFAGLKDWRMIKVLLYRGLDVNTFSHRGVTFLHHFIQDDNSEVLEAILEFKPRLARTGTGELTLLHKAAELNMVKCTKALLNYYDTDARDIYGMTPLLVAVQAESYETIRLLLETGADAEARNKAGRSCIDIAMDQRNGRVAEILAQSGIRMPKKMHSNPPTPVRGGTKYLQTPGRPIARDWSMSPITDLSCQQCPEDGKSRSAKKRKREE
ncbi:hypothetical protein VHEMI03311 [[Torrubiella] hemipterigena]|uniref:Uncharacterized protein n=1 Tax=[Torrubiella] hemipterigena TaxID=1531966 RepID=A0A0A1TD26_9HYPO|nr:hypothetical protein VHEMI03311 [[Torrubiella] hemipterigena]